jgi:CheY-like chemotaxis protein
MKLEKILIADDNEDNRNAALVAIPYAKIVSSAKDAIECLDRENYDLVLTDLQMETKLAGLEVAHTAYQKLIPVYVISHTGPSHEGTSVGVAPHYIHSIDNFKTGKAEAGLWTEILSRIQNPEPVHKAYLDGLERKKKVFGWTKVGPLERDMLISIFLPY